MKCTTLPQQTSALQQQNSMQMQYTIKYQIFSIRRNFSQIKLLKVTANQQLSAANKIWIKLEPITEYTSM